MREAQVVWVPTRCMLSLKATGTPARGPSCFPAARAASVAAAVWSARSAETSRKAWIAGSRDSTASSEALATSVAEKSPAATPAAT